MQMKKYLFFALAAAGMLSSCSSDDVVGNGTNTTDDNSPMPIRIGIGQAFTTRGTGTVGGFTDDDDNVWNGQKFNVYMLNKGTMALARFGENSEIIYENAMFESPNALQTGLAIPSDKSIKYYPPQDKFDFWGYRLDDAEILNKDGKPALGDDSLTVDFKINGSQDVMLAKAVPSVADTAKLVAAGNTAADRAYSSYAARHDVQPNLVFKHQLTRLTFEAIPGGPGAVDATSPVIIDSIKVLSRNTGKMVIATTGDIRGEKQGILWTGPTDSLALMQRKAGDTPDKDLEKLTSVSLKGQGNYTTPGDPTTPFVGTPVAVGEALMVAPDENYEIFIFLHQDVPTEIGSADLKTIKYSYKDLIQRDGGFLAGTSYKVQITLWGLTDIKVTTTLTKWEDGGDPIELRPEDYE